MKNKNTDLEDYYRNLGEVYLAEIESFQEPFNQILIAKGVIVEIESDLIKFLKKSKPTDKSKQQEERLELLKSSVEYFSKIASINYQFKLMLRQAAKDLRMEKERHSNTERALHITTEMLNAE